jgi:hypothetical protein
MKRLELEQQVLRLTRIVYALAALTTVLVAALLHPRLGSLNAQTPVASAPADSILRVRGLVVVDERGMERVWIGAPVTEPRALGKRFSRGARASGILLFDAEGNERGGYVTFDDEGTAHFSLDAVGYMAARISAPASGGVEFLARGDNGSVARFGVAGSAPYVGLLRGDSVFFQAPVHR